MNQKYNVYKLVSILPYQEVFCKYIINKSLVSFKYHFHHFVVKFAKYSILLIMSLPKSLITKMSFWMPTIWFSNQIYVWSYSFTSKLTGLTLVPLAVILTLAIVSEIYQWVLLCLLLSYIEILFLASKHIVEKSY